MTFIIVVIILISVLFGLVIIAGGDKPIVIKRKYWGAIFVVACLEAIVLRMMVYGGISWILLGIFAGCLLLACITDLAMHQVYNFVWWLGGAVAFGLLCSRLLGVSFLSSGALEMDEAFSLCIIIRNLGIFCGLQLVFFRRVYGRADCYAFMCCAVMEAALGMKLQGYLWHMLLAYGILALVQGVKGNIAGNGNLKQPVPFLPYITVSFWGICAYFCCFSKQKMLY